MSEHTVKMVVPASLCDWCNIFGLGSFQHFVDSGIIVKELLKESMPLPIGVPSLGALEVCFVLSQQLFSGV
jgi:hypothetical protein